MKLLVTSDWHLDHVTLGVSRFEELRSAVQETIDAAIRERVDGYVFTGDLCDPDAGTSVFRCVELAQRTANVLHKNGIPSFWLAGNHDVIEDGRGSSTLSPLREVEGATVIEEPMLIKGLAFLPFTSPSRGYDPETFLRTCGATPAVIFAHLNVPGMHPGEETTEMPRGREVMFPLDFAKKERPMLVNGHYHRAATLPVYIPGSLARLTFGEEAYDPGFAILNSATRTWTHVRVGAKSLFTDDADSQTELNPSKGDFVRLRQNGMSDAACADMLAHYRANGIACKLLPSRKAEPLPQEGKLKVEGVEVKSAREVVLELANHTRAPEGDRKELTAYLEDALTGAGL